MHSITILIIIKVIIIIITIIKILFLEKENADKTPQ